MLEWLTGSTRAADAQNARTGNEESYLEEAPETPAPLFAVRAFKTAIFGTPHPDQSNIKRHTQPVEQKPDFAKIKPPEESEGIYAHNAVNGNLDNSAAVSKVDPLASPTKGILLTPGTGATRRKTVSFGSLITDDQKRDEQSASTGAKRDSAPECRKNPGATKTSPEIQPRQSSLTKTLIQMSKQKSNDPAILPKSGEEGPTNEPASNIGAQIKNKDQSPDITVELSHPRSRSGQHWKTEYDQYHKRSNREMKKIIMYGQNVKSYAVKKDFEATCLSEKLKKELAKVATMEEKVSKLAAQLNNAYSHSPKGESEQTRLVSELAQQTALAIRYKQKADQYRKLMQDESRADPSDSEGNRIMASQGVHRGPNLPEIVTKSAEQDTLHSQLETLRMAAKRAEDQAAKLEAENSALKRSLARVKGEMMSYEARRQAREERYKRREAKCKADQKASEAQLAKLTVEHQNLLVASRQSSDAEALAHPQPKAYFDCQRRHEGDAKSSETVPADSNQAKPEPLGQNHVSKRYISPRKNRAQRSTTVDIWTLSSPRDAVDSVSPSKEATELPPSSVRHDIKRTLKEIDQNLVPEQHPVDKSDAEAHLSQANHVRKPPIETTPQPQPEMKHHQRPTVSSPKPATDNNLTSNAAELDPSDAVVKSTVQQSTSTVGRSASLMSRVGSRTGTMTSGRGTALSAERAAAAKARLAARSAEKAEGRGREGRG